MVEVVFFYFPFSISFLLNLLSLCRLNTLHLSFLFSVVVNMDDAMEELWKHFKLSDEEKGIMAVESHEVAISKQQAQFSILFTLQTTKDFNKEAFKSTFCTSLWRSSRGVTIKAVGQNLFLAIFGSEDHLQEIIDKSPWSSI